MLVFQFPKIREAPFLLLAKRRETHSNERPVLSDSAANGVCLRPNTLDLLSRLWGGEGEEAGLTGREIRLQVCPRC